MSPAEDRGVSGPGWHLRKMVQTCLISLSSKKGQLLSLHLHFGININMSGASECFGSFPVFNVLTLLIHIFSQSDCCF